MSERAARRLLIVGRNAADWMLIDPRMERGAMTNLKKLVKAGDRAGLRTLEPTLGLPLWTTSASRGTKALRKTLTQSGLRVHALGAVLANAATKRLIEAAAPAAAAARRARLLPWGPERRNAHRRSEP